jgi:hypothetical protein
MESCQPIKILKDKKKQKKKKKKKQQKKKKKKKLYRALTSAHDSCLSLPAVIPPGFQARPYGRD